MTARLNSFLHKEPMPQSLVCMTDEAAMTNYGSRGFQAKTSVVICYPPQRHRGHKGDTEKVVSPNLNELTYKIIGAAMEVHRTLGPGLLESSYRKCLCRELFVRGIPFRKEQPLPLEYKGIRLECGYRIDIVVARQVVVEVKSVEALAPIHDAQLLTYLRIGGYKLGLLILQCCGTQRWDSQKNPWI
jgi:GxxExxY protein